MSVKLTAKWQLDAAMLSRPIDLTALVTMSKSNPENFLEDKVLYRLTVLLNENNLQKASKVSFSSSFHRCAHYSKKCYSNK